jgi:hypothetical protein
MEQTEKAKPDLSALRIHRDDDEDAGTGRGVRVVLIGTALVLIAGALLVGYRMWTASTTPEVEVAPALIESGNTGIGILTANGYVVADRKAAVSPKISGRLEYLGVDTGSRVKPGQLIARLEHHDLDAQLSEANSLLRITSRLGSRPKPNSSRRAPFSRRPGNHAEKPPGTRETNEPSRGRSDVQIGVR